jgi:hypothetical protein
MKAFYEKSVELFKKDWATKTKFMSHEPAIPRYSHTQKAPLCLVIYALGVVFIVLGFTVEEAPPIQWLFPPVGLLMFLVAASFHHLTVEDHIENHVEGLAIRFGPVPFFRTTVAYSDIASVEVGRTTLLDGWGIHMSIRGGWVWNLWGRDCVVLNLKKGPLRIGTDDAKNLALFLEGKTGGY